MSVKDASIGRENVTNKKVVTILTDEEAVEKEPNGSFAWKVLPPSQIRLLSQCETPDDLQDKMASVMDFPQHEVELKDACLLDYYVTAFHWAKEKNFDERQLSGFMTLVSKLLENIREQRMTKSTNLTYLKECFSGVGFENPNIVSVPLYFFKLEDAKMIMQYLINTLFYHYSLYEYLFTQQQDEFIIGSDYNVEACPHTSGPFPPPLEEAMPAETYEEFVVQYNARRAETSEEKEKRLLATGFTDAVLDAVQKVDTEVVQNVPASELRKIIDRVAKSMIIPAKADIEHKIKDKEAAFLARIEKVQIKST